MDLKGFRDDWETWSKGKKIVSIIVGCCVLTFIFLLIFGALSPDANTMDNYGDDGGMFYINESDIPVKSSTVDITDQQTKSTAYAYFYEDTGEYAEAAYTTYTAENIKVKMDMNKLKLSNDSVIEYSVFFSDPDVYNESNLVDDITELVESGDAFITLKCYSKGDIYQRSYSDELKVSMKDGVLTLKYSYSHTSDFHTKYLDDDLNIDHARVYITGTLNRTGDTRPIDFNLVSEDIPVKTHT